ncbi:MAG: DUF2184 domain-containing protein [bacterium]|nr:DUF2184 domain-containing protein [bacterium]
MNNKFKHIVNADGLATFDAQDLLYFERELEHILAKTYEKRFPEIKTRKLFPVSFEVPNWAENITYYELEDVGDAKAGSTYADDLPAADIVRSRNTSPIIPILTSYKYNINEIRKARALSMPLEQWKANAAKRVALQRENQYAIFGVADRGLYGLLNHPKVSRITVAATGTGSSTLWANKTPDQIIDDINALIDTVFTNTKLEVWPNTLLIAGAQWADIAVKRISSTTDTTVLEWITEKLKVKGITDIQPLNELQGTGTGGSNQMVAYKRDPDFIQLYVSQDFEQFSAQVKGFNFTVPCHMRSGGLIIRDTVAIAIGEGI